MGGRSASVSTDGVFQLVPNSDDMGYNCQRAGMWYFANGCIRLLLPWEPCSQEWIRGMMGWESLIGGWPRIARQPLFAMNRCAERAYVPSVRGQRLIPDTCRSGRYFGTKAAGLPQIG